MSQSLPTAALFCEPVSPQETPEGEDSLPASSHQTVATPSGEPQGEEARDVKTQDTGLIAEVPKKGMISVNLDPCIFPYIEKC